MVPKLRHCGCRILIHIREDCKELQMKVVTILGSPRKHGNTATVLGWVEENLRDDGHLVDRIDCVDWNIKGCMECYSCRKVPDEPGCAQNDDANGLFQRMMSADALVYASPLFCWSWSGQIKPLIDRHFCLVTSYGTPEHDSLLKGKRAALLVTAAGPERDNADLLTEQFNKLMSYTVCHVAGRLILPFCQTPKELSEDVRAKAANLARDITGSTI